MGYKTKVQLIQRKTSKQWYVTLPMACAEMMNFEKGEEVEWQFKGIDELTLKRCRKVNQG